MPEAQHPSFRKETMNAPILSVVMATHSDPKGVLWTLTNLKKEMVAMKLEDDVELLVVDNDPGGIDGTRNLNNCNKVNAKYIQLVTPVGTSQPRDLAIRSARGKWVLCVDCHVQLGVGVLAQLVNWCKRTDSDDLFHGVLYAENWKDITWTHWLPAWGDNAMLGKQAGLKPEELREKDGLPIWGAGLGLFLVMREKWLGFHPTFEAFGGEEGYIHEKYRKAGRQVRLLTWLAWWHEFRDQSEPIKYPTHWGSRCWNYLQSYAEVKFPALSGLKAMFVGKNLIGTKELTSEEHWYLLLERLKLGEQVEFSYEHSKQIMRQPIIHDDGQLEWPHLPELIPLPPLPGDKPVTGVGTELKKIIALFGITPGNNCPCTTHIKQLDDGGLDWCEKNFWTTVGWLKDGIDNWGWRTKFDLGIKAMFNGIAWKIGLKRDPVVAIVRLAIANARKGGAK